MNSLREMCKMGA